MKFRREISAVNILVGKNFPKIHNTLTIMKRERIFKMHPMYLPHSVCKLLLITLPIFRFYEHRLSGEKVLITAFLNGFHHGEILTFFISSKTIVPTKRKLDED